MATEHNMLLGKHAPIQSVSPHLPLSLSVSLSLQLQYAYEQSSLAMSALFAANLQAEFGS